MWHLPPHSLHQALNLIQRRISPVTSSPLGAVHLKWQMDPFTSLLGDRLLIQHRATTAWLAAVKYGQPSTDPDWTTADDELTMKFEGIVIAKAGNIIKLDTPFYSEHRRSLSQSTVSKLSGDGVLSKCGLENLRVVSYTTSTDTTNESHRRDCVHFINVRDCWASSVTTAGFVRSGFLFSNSIRSTVQDCSAVDPISKIEDERRHNFRVYTDCHNLLFKGCTSSKGRHDFHVSVRATTSGIVITKCKTSGSYTTSGTLRKWGSGILFDDTTFATPNSNSALTISLGLGYNRGNMGNSSGWTGTQMVGWNVTAKKIVVQQGPTGQNYAIACKGAVNNQGPFVYKVGFVEGINQMPSIASLYEAQLAEREYFLSLGVSVAPPDAPVSLTVTASFVLSWSWTDIDPAVIQHSDARTVPTLLSVLLMPLL